MFNALAQNAEMKMREAIKNGELDNLPGKGKPLEIDNMSFIPAELRMAYRIINCKKVKGAAWRLALWHK